MTAKDASALRDKLSELATACEGESASCLELTTSLLTLSKSLATAIDALEARSIESAHNAVLIRAIVAQLQEER